MAQQGDDGRQQNNFGNVIIESGNPNSSLAGAEAFSIKGTNSSDKRFLLAHHDGGITRVETEQTLQLDAGSKGNNQGTAAQITAHTGNVAVNVEDGHLLLKANQTITLEAKDIILKGSNLIQIGGPEQHDTREIKLTASKIEIKAKKGNLADFLEMSSFLLSTNGPQSFVGDMAKNMAVGAATAYAGPIGGAVAGRFFS